VRAATGFHADQARGQFGEPLQQLGPAQRLAGHHLFLSIDRVDLENTFGQVEADSANLRHGWLPWVGVMELQLWHIDAVRGPSTPSWPGLSGSPEPAKRRS